MQSQEPKRVPLKISDEPLQPNRWADRDTSFAGMLQNLLDSAAAASETKSMGKLPLMSKVICLHMSIVRLRRYVTIYPGGCE